MNTFFVSIFSVEEIVPSVTGMVWWHYMPCENNLQHWVYLEETIPGALWSKKKLLSKYWRRKIHYCIYITAWFNSWCPAEFSSIPNKTHPNQLIKLLLGILETSQQVCWGKLLQKTAGHRPSGTEFGHPWFNLYHSNWSPKVQYPVLHSETEPEVRVKLQLCCSCRNCFLTPSPV